MTEIQSHTSHLKQGESSVNGSPFAVLLCWCVLLIGCSEAQPEKRLVVDLSGAWKFKPGDVMVWALPEFDDTTWRYIRVPGAWEDQGFAGYDGFAWYRTSFDCKEEWLTGMVYLHLGRIDDVDEVYLNGRKLGGTGSFPPQYATAYQHHRRYYVPQHFLFTDKPNVIALRVYDDRLMGGILEGQIGLYVDATPPPSIDLAGFWHFSLGDDILWAQESTDISTWDKLQVPKKWDEQGHAHYDGFAWYALRFSFQGFTTTEQLVLSLGKIDDADEVWLNGVNIGRTGAMPHTEQTDLRPNTHLIQRWYAIPDGLLRFEGENYLAVRVYDHQFTGGIYDGPVGIYLASQAAYVLKK